MPKRDMKRKAEKPSPQHVEALRLLRQSLASGRLGSVANLSEANLERFFKSDGLTIASIRKAISVLSSEGILDIVPQSGTFLHKWKTSEILELWFHRTSLEEFVIVQLASNRNPNFQEVNRLHSKMLDLAGDDEFKQLESDQQSMFVELDQNFHLALAHAAGLPHIAHQLENLSFQLHVALPLKPFKTKKRLIQICKEHAMILGALNALPSTGIVQQSIKARPSINEVRHAFRVHMRNAGRESWGIESLIDSTLSDYSSNLIFSVPDIKPLQSPNRKKSKLNKIDGIQAFNLANLRFSIEIYAAVQVSSNPSADSKFLFGLHHEMDKLVETYEDEDELTPDAQTMFENLDMSFHSSLAFCGGLLFADEIITFVFRELKKFYRRRLNGSAARTILKEHRDILNQLSGYAGTSVSSKTKKVESTVRAVKAHLYNSFFRNCFDEVLLETLKIEADEMVALLKKIRKSKR